MNVLETTAASMIILIQDKLIPTPAAMAYQDGSMYYQSYDNGFDGIDDGEHEPMHLLMNYPRMDDITHLVEIFQKPMASQRSGSKPSKIQMAHQSQAHILPFHNSLFHPMNNLIHRLGYTYPNQITQ